MFKRQFLLLLLLAGVAYLWWQSRLPSHYSEWAEDLKAGGQSEYPQELTLLDPSGAQTWSFDSGDSSYQVTTLTRSADRLFKLQVTRVDSLLWSMRMDLDLQGHLQRIQVTSAGGKQIEIISYGDSAQFKSATRMDSAAWIPWSEDAVLFEAIPALADSWASVDSITPVTLIRVNVQTEVIVQVPAVITRRDQTTLSVDASGHELARITFDSIGQTAVSVCQQMNRCWTRTSGLSSDASKERRS